MHWQRITIIGAGMLGGSLGLAIRKRKLADRVQACVRRAESAAQCLQLGVADFATLDMGEAVEGADLIVLCTPLSQMAQSAAAMARHLKAGALVTDVGSVKVSVVQSLEPVVRRAGAVFVGSHPMAGSEKTGLQAAHGDLFEKATCVVTPSAQSPAERVSVLETFWKEIGCCPVRMTPEMHDDLVSRASHLPHVVAAELANYVLSPAHPKEQAMVCANGFRDTTRIAAGSAEMWRDISLANRKNLSRVLGVFIEDLQEFQLALDRQDVNVIEEFFAKARQRREQWRADFQTGSPE